ncbi:hypothetical protein BpHYR1_044569 [Brachionus plicatilis]|uniref:Uncharacterized protein n=1 Tax=Brachionus plicatilis TaxID=10195 RepID=A0A3M7R151_BRAPC|nr:hypothetical protein BpHYR1_044569 [Brachionus plicatilis]
MADKVENKRKTKNSSKFGLMDSSGEIRHDSRIKSMPHLFATAVDLRSKARRDLAMLSCSFTKLVFNFYLKSLLVHNIAGVSENEFKQGKE